MHASPELRWALLSRPATSLPHVLQAKAAWDSCKEAKKEAGDKYAALQKAQKMPPTNITADAAAAADDRAPEAGLETCDNAAPPPVGAQQKPTEQQQQQQGATAKDTAAEVVAAAPVAADNSNAVVQGTGVNGDPQKRTRGTATAAAAVAAVAVAVADVVQPASRKQSTPSRSPASKLMRVGSR